MQSTRWRAEASLSSWPKASLWGLLPVSLIPPVLLTLQLSLSEFHVLQLSQEEVGAALQVGAGHVELHVGHQLLEAGKVRGLAEVL